MDIRKKLESLYFNKNMVDFRIDYEPIIKFFEELKQQYEQLQQENQRLREVLERLSIPNPDCDCDCDEIAQKALEQK